MFRLMLARHGCRTMLRDEAAKDPRKITFFRDEWPSQDERILINHHILHVTGCGLKALCPYVLFASVLGMVLHCFCPLLECLLMLIGLVNQAHPNYTLQFNNFLNLSNSTDSTHTVQLINSHTPTHTTQVIQLTQLNSPNCT